MSAPLYFFQRKINNDEFFPHYFTGEKKDAKSSLAFVRKMTINPSGAETGMFWAN